MITRLSNKVVLGSPLARVVLVVVALAAIAAVVLSRGSHVPSGLLVGSIWVALVGGAMVSAAACFPRASAR
jgi:hypothetical protein